MDNWERIALQTISPTPKICFRYVDGTLTVLKSEYFNVFLAHINSVVNAIEFTYNQGEVAVLHCKIKRTQDGSLEPGVMYRKPTHSNGYLDFMSSHPISVRVGLVKW
ncbi:unnamed protein product [Heterobilharzia americana]|nr:unnamed protein product [Heterobilharzia americana]